jgi:phosphoserine phosphatase
VTAFIGRFESAQHRVRYHSAGQGPLLHFHAADDRAEWLQPTMPPLGVLGEMVDEGERAIELAPGDWLVLATDGFYEAQNARSEQFGAERVTACVQRCKNDSAEALIKALLRGRPRLRRGAPQADDMTIVASNVCTIDRRRESGFHLVLLRRTHRWLVP